MYVHTDVCMYNESLQVLWLALYDHMKTMVLVSVGWRVVASAFKDRKPPTYHQDLHMRHPLTVRGTLFRCLFS